MKTKPHKPRAKSLLKLGLHLGLSYRESYDRIAAALDAGTFGSGAAAGKLAIDLLRVRATVVAAEEFRARLDALNAQRALPPRQGGDAVDAPFTSLEPKP